MISRTVFMDIFILIFLIALQIFVLNRIIIFGKYTPVLYPVFVMFYPFFKSRYQLLITSFILGLGIDAFLYTWGINAFATTLIAYYRTVIFRTSTETSTDFFSFQSLSWSQFFLFIFSSIFMHQFVVQYLEFFKFYGFFDTFINIIITSIISFFFILLYVLIFKIKQRI